MPAAETMRNIDFNEDLISGDLRPLAELVKDSEHLELCYRGNQNVITVYYKSHVVFKVLKYSEQYREKGKCKVFFNFGHARYTEGWEESYEKLNKKLGFFHSSDKPEFDKKKDDKNIKSVIDGKDTSFWRESEKIIKPLIDDFFCTEKKKDWFKDESKATKNPLLEKIRQQEIMTALKSTDTGYFVYDMEYAQKRSSKNEETLGKPDMLALKFESGKPKNIVLVEVKSTKKACVGKYGVDAHFEAMNQYIQCKEPADYIKIRKTEAVKIFNDYAKVGLRGLNDDNYLAITPDSLGVELLFIFTDGAIGQINKNTVDHSFKKIFKDGALI